MVAVIGTAEPVLWALIVGRWFPRPATQINEQDAELLGRVCCLPFLPHLAGSLAVTQTY